MTKNYHKSRTSHDIDMKLGPVTKLDKRNTLMLKKFDNDGRSANWDVIFFLFIANLEPSGGRIPNA